MIQRIQSLYLLVAVVLLSVMFFSPFAVIPTADGELFLKPFLIGEGAQSSLSAVSAVIYFSIILLIVLLISLSTIFIFKNRILQSRMCTINMALLLGLQVYVGFSIYRATSFIEQMNVAMSNFSAGVSYKVVAVFPVVALIFVYLAFRGILKDELLIKSLDRLR